MIHAKSSDAARAILDDGGFDLVISDIDRDNRKDEGVAFAEAEGIAQHTPLLFYIMKVRDAPPPAGSFGITGKAPELFHFVCDALERRRF